MGLGTGRRGMKSPPLLIAVLLACVFVLGINYWITSSRCVELQNRVMELEGRMRRAAAERGAVEMKKNEYEDMLAKQKKQIDSIQSLHNGQMLNVRALCDSEKEQLLSNITAKDNLVQTLQVQISNAYKRLEEFKLEVKDLEDTQARKLSFELAQCSNKIAEVKEQCEEKLRKASAKDGKVLKPTPKTEVILQNVQKNEEVKLKRTPDLPLSATEEINMAVSSVKKEEANKLKLSVTKKPIAAPQQHKPKVLEKDDDEQEPANEVNPDSVNAAEEDDEIKTEDVVDKESNKENENEEVERENLINMDGLHEERKGAKPNEREEAEKQNDYNGDEANEAEPETDKQAELIDNGQNLKDGKTKNGLNGQAAEQEAEEEELAGK